MAAGIAAGLVVGIIAALMGVAGGELLIPTIVLLYAVDVKLAGSLSLAVSLPTMLVAFARYSRDGSFVVLREHRNFVLAMAAGSVTGTIGGGLLLGVVPIGVLVPWLVALLLASSVKVWRHDHGPLVQAPPLRRPGPRASAMQPQTDPAVATVGSSSSGPLIGSLADSPLSTSRTTNNEKGISATRTHQRDVPTSSCNSVPMAGGRVGAEDLPAITRPRHAVQRDHYTHSDNDSYRHGILQHEGRDHSHRKVGPNYR